MGLRSWLRERARRAAERRRGLERGAALKAEEAREVLLAPGCPAREWDEVSAYLPVDPREHEVACVVASALAAGARAESSLVVRRVSMSNPEYRRVACIATALGAGALEKSSFTVKRIYKKRELESEDAS
ncbi:MAG: hypothetical protein SOU51_01950 [Collinsella sp.]|nr:hypothetical protein [Collinsella sp.]